MSQTQISIETSVYEKMKHIADKKGMTVSGYVNELLEKSTGDTPGKGRVWDFFGVVKDDTFDVPEDRPESWDAPRETL